MLAHIYYVNRLPISFWIIVPVSTLVLGALAWRSKTISSSLAVCRRERLAVQKLGFCTSAEVFLPQK